MSKPDLRLKTASIPIGRLHYHKAKHRDGKVLSRTHHECSGSQLPVIRKGCHRKITELLQPVRLSRTRTELWFGSRSLSPFHQLRTVEPRHRKLKASDNRYGSTFMYLVSEVILQSQSMRSNCSGGRRPRFPQRSDDI